MAIDLFTPDEHAILALWFGVEPPAFVQDIVGEEAVSRLGFAKKPDPYRRIDAAVAFIVLERAEQLILAREFPDGTNVPNRKVVLQPRHLFTINWADRGPGSWPMAYYVTWLSYYDRFLVTASADRPDMFGYCDFALGAFGIDKPIKEGAREIICADWTKLRAFERERWVSLLPFAPNMSLDRFFTCSGD